MAAVRGTGLRGKESGSRGGLEMRRGARTRGALETIVAGTALAFLAASVVHFGIPIPLGFATLADATILPAAIAEGAIGIAFAFAALAALVRQEWAWSATVGAYLFGILGVLVGLGVTLNDSVDSSPTNLVFHELILPVLVIGLTFVLTPSGKAALGRTVRRKERGP